MLRLAAAARDQLVAHAAAGHPHEVVGLLARSPDDDSLRVVHPLVNEDARPGVGFLVSTAALAAATRALADRGLAVAATYHSHADQSARWSKADRAQAEVGVPQVIVSITARGARELRAWCLRPDRQAMDELAVEIVD
jgi:proteasome lid subunit RPN8/RPN11